MCLSNIGIGARYERERERIDRVNEKRAVIYVVLEEWWKFRIVFGWPRWLEGYSKIALLWIDPSYC